LAASIAVGDASFDTLDALDDIIISFTSPGTVWALDDLLVSWWDMVDAVDEVSIHFHAGGHAGVPKDLSAYIMALKTYKDLSAYINAVAQSSYVFGDPIFGPFESDVLFTAPYIYKSKVLWERVVEISFYSQVYEYFYQSVTDSLWKDDNTEKWVLNVASWLEEDTYLQDRTSLREKLVNNIEEFESIDEAIRYAIDWVLTFPTRDLGAQIQGIIPPYTDLLARINAFKTYSSAQNLTARVVPFHPTDLSAFMTIIDEWGDLSATITGTP
jgi:hypothetical protein